MSVESLKKTLANLEKQEKNFRPAEKLEEHIKATGCSRKKASEIVMAELIAIKKEIKKCKEEIVKQEKEALK